MIKFLSKISLLTYGALFLVFIGIMGINTYINYIEGYNNGRNVVVEVVEKPLNCESINSRNAFIRVKYNNLILPKKVGKKYCDILDEDFIEMRLSSDGKTLFFIDRVERFPDQIIASSLIALVGAIIFLISLRKKKI